MDRIAVIMCTYVPMGKIEYGCPVRSAKTDKYINYNEDKFETIKCTIKCHEHYNAGMDYDLIIVDNNSEDRESVEFLEQHYNFYSRENVGFSFGAFEWAFNKFKNEYDYFLFQEQDVCPIKDGWLKEFYDVFNSEDNVGGVGNVLERRCKDSFGILYETTYIAKYLYPNIEILENFDGLITFVKTTILEKALEKYPWKLVPSTPSNIGEYPATINELIFQMPLTLAGYKLIPIQGVAGRTGSRIGTYGVSMADSTDEVDTLPIDKLCPMIHCNARLFHPRFKELMSWYYE